MRQIKKQQELNNHPQRLKKHGRNLALFGNSANCTTLACKHLLETKSENRGDTLINLLCEVNNGGLL